MILNGTDIATYEVLHIADCNELWNKKNQRTRKDGSSLPCGAKILPCLLTQSNGRDIFSLLMATELAPRGKEVPALTHSY